MLSCLCLRVENRTHEIPFFGLHHVHRCVSTRGSCPSSLPRYIPHTCSHLESVRVQSATQCTECRYILHTCSHLESIRVQSATEWTASVHTLHMPKPNVTRVQSATEWTASVHTLHMKKISWMFVCAAWNICSSKADQTHRRAEDRWKKTRPASWLPEIGEHKEPLKHTRHVHGYRHHDVPDTH